MATVAAETAPRKRALWLDCDPGHDDAMAIILATHSPELQVLGVSTVAGNMPLDKTTENALKVLYVIDRAGIPVVPGAAVPLMRPTRVCPEIHGDSGLDGHEFPALPKEMAPTTDAPAAVAMAAAIKAHHASTGERVTLVATGCLTNVALLLSMYPEDMQTCLEEIVLMGGAVGVGNTSPVAEFNIQVDPEAASIVFRRGIFIPVVMVPLEVTHTALVTKEIFARIDGLGTPFSVLVHELLKFFASTYESVFDMPDPPLHDPCAVAYVLRPDLFKVKSCHVDVETSSELSAGQTVVDLLNIRGLATSKNAKVCLEMDVAAFWDLMLGAVESANAVSVMNAEATP